MPEIEKIPLPGVGQRIEFVSDEGNRVGVVHHMTGQREVFVCSPSDPDAVAFSIRLSHDESHALADALGGSTLVSNLTNLEQQVEGLAIDWLHVHRDSSYVGKTIGEARIRTETGASVVAVIRDERAHPAPGPDFEFAADDTLVLVGTLEGVAAVREILIPG